MAKRKSDSPQKATLREMMSTYMKENNVLPKNGTDVNSIMRDMMSIILEGTSAIQSMITGTKIPRTAVMDIQKRLCIPVMATWISTFPETVKVNLNRRS